MIEIILPFLFFLLAFLLVFGSLNKLKIFHRSLNSIIAAVVAFYTLFAYFFFAETTQKLMAYIGIIIAVVFGAAIIYSLMPSEKKGAKHKVGRIMAAFLLLAFLLFLLLLIGRI